VQQREIRSEWAVPTRRVTDISLGIFGTPSVRTFGIGSRDDSVLPYRSYLDGTLRGAVKALTH
jgi:hypothetical protein